MSQNSQHLLLPTAVRGERDKIIGCFCVAQAFFHSSLYNYSALGMCEQHPHLKFGVRRCSLLRALYVESLSKFCLHHTRGNALPKRYVLCVG